MRAISVVLTDREIMALDDLTHKGYARSRADFVRQATIAYINACNEDFRGELNV